MSFLKAWEIYPSDVHRKAGSRLGSHSPRSSARMSLSRLFLAGCSPAAPDSASPARISMLWFQTKAKAFTANGNLSPISLSHLRGAVHYIVSFTLPLRAWLKVERQKLPFASIVPNLLLEAGIRVLVIGESSATSRLLPTSVTL